MTSSRCGASPGVQAGEHVNDRLTAAAQAVADAVSHARTIEDLRAIQDRTPPDIAARAAALIERESRPGPWPPPRPSRNVGGKAEAS